MDDTETDTETEDETQPEEEQQIYSDGLEVENDGFLFESLERLSIRTIASKFELQSIISRFVNLIFHLADKGNKASRVGHAKNPPT